MRAFDRICETDGNGHWSRLMRKVQCLEMDLQIFIMEDCDPIGELRIFFDTDTWNIDKHGLIYTDPLFRFDVWSNLNRMGYDTRHVDYSEQGMQGTNYVSFDVDLKFIQSWKDKEPKWPDFSKDMSGEEINLRLQKFWASGEQDWSVFDDIPEHQQVHVMYPHRIDSLNFMKIFTNTGRG